MMFSSIYKGSHSEKDTVDGYVVSDNDCGFTGSQTYESELTALLFRCYIEGPDEYLSRSTYTSGDASGLDSAAFTSIQNSDVKVLLQCTVPLLWSQNSAVVLAAAGVHWIMAQKDDVKRIVKPLLFTLRSSQASKYVVLCNILAFAKAMPSLFSPYFEDFFICSSDSYEMKALKLEILSTIATDSSIPLIFQELQDYIRDPDRRFVCDTVAAIGLCAQKLPTIAYTCLECLLALMKQESSNNDLEFSKGEAGALAQAVMSIKAIIKQNPASYEKVIVQLARSLDTIKVPAARAMIVWIVGEYSSVGQIIPRIVITVLKYLAWCFTSEGLETKHQILNTNAKVVLCAQGEDLWTFKRILSYVLELAKCDLNYDVRDRAHIIEKLLSCHIAPQCVEEGTQNLLQDADIQNTLAEHIFSGKTKSTLDTPNNFRFYLPGSLSQIVLHAAPGYEPLPKPCSLHYDDSSEMVAGAKIQQARTANSDDSGISDPDTLSGSSIEESASGYSSRHSITSSVDSEGIGDTGDDDHSTSLMASHDTEDGDKDGPLIHLSDVGVGYNKPKKSAEENESTSFSTDLADFMSKKTLESWLDEQSSMPESGSSKQWPMQPSSARISIRDIGVKPSPKIYTLLDPAYGNGLRVDYSFSSEISIVSPLLVCVEISFENCSTESLEKISVKEEESNESPEPANQASERHESSSTSHYVPTMIPMEEIASLDPGQTAKKALEVRFHHHLLPLKLAIFSNGKKHPIKLRPDIGYFIKPLSMDMEAFTNKESKLPGMFEYTRRCNFTDHMTELSYEKDRISFNNDKLLVVCRSLASKVLGNTNFFLLSVDMPIAVKIDDASGLCLRFSGEVLSSSFPCLITLTVEGKCSEPLNILVKVNCEETIFGLNLLNRVVAFLSETSQSAQL